MRNPFLDDDVEIESMKFEYKVLTPNFPDTMERELNEAAQDGWVLYSVEQRGVGWLVVMERPIL